MSTEPRNFPRFLPTLTEIVQPPEPAPVDIPATPGLEEMVWFVMQRVDLVLERRLTEETESMLHSVVADQIVALSASLRQELEIVVRQAVSEAVMSGAGLHKSK